MNDEELEAALRRVLADPSHRLPDSLVPLVGVHAGARRRKARRQAMSAVAGATAGVLAVVAFIGIGHLAQGRSTSAAGASQAATTGGSTPSLVRSADGSTAPGPASGSGTPSVSVGSRVPVPAGFTPVSVTAINATQWWVLGTGGQVADTTDGGKTFSLVGDRSSSGLPASASELRFADRSHGWAVTSNDRTAPYSLWRTADGGVTWQGVRLPVTGPASTVGSIELGGGEAYALVTSSAGAWTVWAAAADGSTPWRPVGSLGSALPFQPVLAVHSGRAVVANTGAGTVRTWVVSAGSRTSSTRPCDPSLGAGDISATVGGVWLSCANGTGDSLWRSGDGSTWVKVPGPGQATRMVVGAIDAQHAAVGLQDGSIILVASAGATGVAHGPFTLNDQWRYLAFTNKSDGFAIDLSGRMLRTTDGGLSWTRVSFG